MRVTRNSNETLLINLWPSKNIKIKFIKTTFNSNKLLFTIKSF